VGRPLVRRVVHDVEQGAVVADLPAVIDAADAAVLDAAEGQRRAAMRAQLVEHADLALAVAEDDEILAQQPLEARRAARSRHPVGGADRQPETPEDGAHRRPRPDPAQTVVLRSAHHGTSSGRLTSYQEDDLSSR